MKSQNARGGLEIPEILKGKSRHISRITMTIALGFSAAAVESWRIITTLTSKLIIKIFFQPKIVHSATLSIKYESEIRVSLVIQHRVGCRAEGGGRGSRQRGRAEGKGRRHWVICPWSCVAQTGCVMEEEEEEALVKQLPRSLGAKESPLEQ